MKQFRRPSQALLRTSLGFALLLCLGLVLFCALVSLNLRRSLTAALDGNLQAAAAQVRDQIELVDGQPQFRATLRDLESGLSAEQLSGRLIDGSGAVRGGFGSYRLLPPSRPTTPGMLVLRSGTNSWRVYTSRVVSVDGAPLGWVQLAASLAPIERSVGALGTQMLLTLPVIFVLATCAMLWQRAPLPFVGRSFRLGVGAPAAPEHDPHVSAPPVEPLLPETTIPLPAAAQPAAVAGHAAAAFRPALAALRATLDVLDRKRSTKRDYELALRAAAKQLAELDALQSNLALVAGDVAARPKGGVAVVVPAELIAHVVEPYADAAAARGVTLHLELGSGGPIVGDRADLEQLCADLVAAALAQTPDGADITLSGQDGVDHYTISLLYGEIHTRADGAEPISAGAAWLRLSAARLRAARNGGSVTTSVADGRLWIALSLPVEASTEALATAEPAPVAER